MARLFHVSPAANRASIDEHGLDWTLMGAAAGIAGSSSPEVEGVFLCRDIGEVQFFMGIRNGVDADVWAVDGIDERDLVESPEGFAYLPARITRDALTRIDPPAPLPSTVHDGPSSAYQSTLTITLDDGTVLTGEQAHDLIRRHST